jgi:hypothetical protein
MPDRQLGPADRRRAVARWRADEGVPDRIMVADGDRQQLSLRLDDEAHLRILRQECGRSGALR